MRPSEKRETWRRITQLGEAWRFNRYAERASGRQVQARLFDDVDTTPQT
jgi:hypothetical protein